MPGASTPSEVLACANSGVDAVKVFPAPSYSPAYLGELRAVIPATRMIVTGGLRATEDRACAWLTPGALTVGLGGEFGSVFQRGADEVTRRAVAALRSPAGVSHRSR